MVSETTLCFLTLIPFFFCQSARVCGSRIQCLAHLQPHRNHGRVTSHSLPLLRDTMPPGLSPSPPPRCSSMGASVVPLVPLERCYNGCFQNSLWCSMQRTRCLCLLDRTLNTLAFMLPLVAGLTCSTIQSPPIADCSIP